MQSGFARPNPGLHPGYSLSSQATLRGGTAIQRLAYNYTNADDLTTIDDQVDGTKELTERLKGPG